MAKYERIIFWSEEDGCWLVDVPELPGCMADGVTPAEALENAEKMISEWLETAKEIGRDIPEPKGRLLYAWFKSRGVTVSAFFMSKCKLFVGTEGRQCNMKKNMAAIISSAVMLIGFSHNPINTENSYRSNNRGLSSFLCKF